MGEEAQLLLPNRRVRRYNAEDDDEDEGFLGSEPDIRVQTLTSSEEGEAGITWYKATFLIVNAALGAGILNFPFAFNETGGIVSGNLAHLIFFTFAVGSLLLFAICGTVKNCCTYQEVVTKFCGPRWGIVCSLCVTLYCFVTCITFIIIIGDQFDRAFASFVGPDFCQLWYLNRKFTMVIAALLLIFPSCLKRIDGMEMMSYIGVAAVIYLVIVILIEKFIGHYPKGEIHVMDVHILKFFNVVPTISFGYQCHVSSVPIMSCLKRREKSNILKAGITSMLICFMVYTLSANCGYLTFGSKVSSDILLDYDARQVFVLAAVLLLGLKAWTTYPILLFCVREAVGDIYLRVMDMDVALAAQTEPKRRRVIAFLLWVSTIVFAVFIPGLNIVIKLLGSLASVFILIFPGMCYLNMTLNKSPFYDYESKLSYWTKILVSCIYIVIGFFTLGLAFSLGVESFFSTHTEKPICEISGQVQLLYASEIELMENIT